MESCKTYRDTLENQKSGGKHKETKIMLKSLEIRHGDLQGGYMLDSKSVSMLGCMLSSGYHVWFHVGVHVGFHVCLSLSMFVVHVGVHV